MATKMVAALNSSDNRSQVGAAPSRHAHIRITIFDSSRLPHKKKTRWIEARGMLTENSVAIARLEALENDNAGAETVEINDDSDASLDDEEGYTKRQSKNMKRKTRQARALEIAKKAPKTFMELLQDANFEALPPHVPSYLRAAVGPPSSTSRRHFCTVWDAVLLMSLPGHPQ
ncbi:hypothetical protein ACLOJK_020015 [Asimina triloba]